MRPARTAVGAGELHDRVVPAEAHRRVVEAEAERLGLPAVQDADDRQRRVDAGRHPALAGAVHDAVALPDRGGVADRVHPRVRHRPQRRVGDDPADPVHLQPGRGGQRRHPHTARPHDGVGGDGLPARQLDGVRQHLGHLGPGAHPHAEPRERPVHVRPRAGVHGRGGRLPAQQHDVQAGVALGDLRCCLDPGEPAPADHDGPAPEPRQPRGEHPRLVRPVERVSVLLGPRHRRRVGDAPERVHEGVVAQHPLVVDPHGPGLGVDAGDPAPHELRARPLQQVGDPHPRELLPRPGHVQPQPLGELRPPVHHGQPHPVPAADPGRELHARRQPRVPRTEHHDPVAVPAVVLRVHPLPPPWRCRQRDGRSRLGSDMARTCSPSRPQGRARDQRTAACRASVQGSQRGSGPGPPGAIDVHR